MEDLLYQMVLSPKYFFELHQFELVFGVMCLLLTANLYLNFKSLK